MLSISRAFFVTILVTTALQLSHAYEKPYHVRSELDGKTGNCTLIDAGRIHFRRDLSPTDGVIVKYKRRNIDHDLEQTTLSPDDSFIIELTGFDEDAVQAEMQKHCKNTLSKHSFEAVDGSMASASVQKRDANVEVRKIVYSGPPGNRIDVVFMGDGYTLAEKSKFFDDIKRLTKAMFLDVTYRSTLPLYNIWAVYVESKESGIGVNGVAKDTAFGLYRQGTELRGIYPGKPVAAREACKKTGLSACDFPSLIGNSPYYGGLGGEFIIGTSSKTSGTITLRHEMGHNFIGVGEEYDGGQVYRGCNYAGSLNTVPWKHWLSGPLREEKSILRVQKYTWYDLAGGPYKIQFTSNGQYNRWYLKISTSGVEKIGSLEVYLDGRRLPWKTSGNLDRFFSTWFREKGFSAGQHELEFRSGFPPPLGAPIRQLCSVNLHEYAGQKEFKWDSSYISAYPTVAENLNISYRPTNEGCLMRNMATPKLCKVCNEGLWLHHLKKITLIDGVTYSCSGSTYKFALKAIPLAGFRPNNKKIAGERYLVRWYHNGVHKANYDNDFRFSHPRGSTPGEWKVRLRFVTREVRSDPTGLLTSEEKFTIGEGCNANPTVVKSW